jgi:hypothetical protein
MLNPTPQTVKPCHWASLVISGSREPGVLSIKFERDSIWLVHLVKPDGLDP